MWKIIEAIQKKLVIAIPLSMLAGILYGLTGPVVFLKSLIIPMTFVMVYPMMVNLQFKTILKGGDTPVQIMTQAVNFAIIPFVAYGIGRIFFADTPYIALGLLLAALLPTSGMTISWTGFARGNMNAAVKMTVFGLILGSLATPLYARWLMGTVINIPMSDIFSQIALVVFLPMTAGYATQRYIIARYGQERYRKEFKGRFPLISTVGVIAIVFIAMALKAKSIFANPGMLVELFIPLVLLYGSNFLISTFVGRFFFSRADGIALVYGTVMRNLSIALAIAMTLFADRGSEIALIISLAYIIQVQSAAWYVKFTDIIFGKADTEENAGDQSVMETPRLASEAAD